MPPVIGWQEDSVRLVVRRDDDAGAIERRSVRGRYFSLTRSTSGGAAV